MSGKFAAVFAVLISLILTAGVCGAQEPSSRSEAVAYRVSQSAVFIGWGLDSWTTAKAINDPPRAEYWYCGGGVDVNCQDPLKAKSIIPFKEVGSPSWLGLQNPAAISVASAAFDAGFLFANDRLLYRRGGTWRKASIIANFSLAAMHILAAASNLNDIKSARDRVSLVPAGAFNIRFNW